MHSSNGNAELSLNPFLAFRRKGNRDEARKFANNIPFYPFADISMIIWYIMWKRTMRMRTYF